MSPYEREVARLLKLLMISLEFRCSDRSDIREVAARVKRMRGDDPLFTRLAYVTACRALRWSVFDKPGDEQNLYDAAYALLKELNRRYAEYQKT
jgi:hypothetical protein